jgi:hypothetical protein
MAIAVLLGGVHDARRVEIVISRKLWDLVLHILIVLKEPFIRIGNWK